MKKGKIITLPNSLIPVDAEDILEISPKESVAIIKSTEAIKKKGLSFQGKKYFPSDFIWLGSKIGILI